MNGELDGTNESHADLMKFGEISCYYHVDISEIEYKDMTKTFDAEKTDPSKYTWSYLEKDRAVYQSFKFRQMKTVRPTN